MIATEFRNKCYVGKIEQKNIYSISLITKCLLSQELAYDNEV